MVRAFNCWLGMYRSFLALPIRNDSPKKFSNHYAEGSVNLLDLKDQCPCGAHSAVRHKARQSVPIGCLCPGGADYVITEAYLGTATNSSRYVPPFRHSKQIRFRIFRAMSRIAGLASQPISGCLR